MKNDSTYIIKYSNLKTLLCGMGYNKISGLDIGEKPLDNEFVLNSLMEMTDNGFISSDGDRFFISQDIKKIVECIGNATAYIAVCTNSKRIGDICCYLENNRILICRQSSINSQFLSVHFVDFEGFLKFLYEGGYISGNSEKFPIDMKKLIEYDNYVIKNSYSSSKESPVKLSINFVNNFGKTEKYLRITECYFYDYIVYYDGEEKEYDIFSLETFEKRVKRLLI